MARFGLTSPFLHLTKTINNSKLIVYLLYKIYYMILECKHIKKLL